ncbi:MAG TPA: hypothetical protein VEX41_11640 [Candidatus Eisenbacteria bacterium]|nr:hypothetical protein [Candidatus Eisenbacteria bacterium]
MAWDSDIGDAPPPLWRDTAPDLLAPIDEEAPVSGHRPPAEAGTPISASAGHDWTAAAGSVLPVLRPPDSAGTQLGGLDAVHLRAAGMRTHALPVIDRGPAGLAIAYVLRAASFDVLVNADHLLGWAIEPGQLRDAALRNLAEWSATAPWTDELSGSRRLLSSATGDGGDAARILLANVRRYLAEELGSGSRVLVGLPDRHMLVAGACRTDDRDFAALFADFIVEQSGGADEPIDRRVFELVAGELQPFVA